MDNTTFEVEETMTDRNREFAELTGLCWHEWDIPTLQGQMFTCKLCGEWSEKPFHPDYAADPRLVLREMILKCKDWDGFVDRIGARIGGQAYFHHAFILDTNGLCRDQAIVWLKRDERTG